LDDALDDPSVEESLDEVSLDELSGLDFSSVLSLDPESPPEDPGKEDFLG